MTKKRISLNFILSLICITTLVACSTPQKVTPIITQKTLQKNIEIAILMPMSGEESTLGHQYNQLIKMGLEDGLNTYVHATSYDGSDEKHIIDAMDKIISRKTKIILGPLYSKFTSLIYKKAKKNNIIMITMSNDPTLANDNLFVFGHAPLKQLTKIINYFGDSGYKDFIALLPVGQYSQTVNHVIQNMIIQQNAILARSEFYSNSLESIEKSVLIVSNNVDNLNELDDSLAKPVIYLSDNPSNLKLIFDNIRKYYLDKKAIIIGDNRIDIDYPEDINLVFTGSYNIINNVITERAKSLGINHLSFMHSLAYDLGKMTATYIGNEFVSEQFLAKMNSRKVYSGISGNIRFIDSIAQREYDIIKKENSMYSPYQNN